MMKVYYCTRCKRYRYTNNSHRTMCCKEQMYVVDVEFEEFTQMTLEERKDFLVIYSLRGEE